MRTTDVRVRRAITAIAAGRPVVVTDDTARGEQGYVMLAAEAATPGLLAFTVRHTSGYVRVALPGAECDRLNLPPMCHRAGDGPAVGDRVAVDWCGVGTGISATDRARTIAALAAASVRRIRLPAPGSRRPGAGRRRRSARISGTGRGGGGSCPACRQATGSERCARSSPVNAPPRWPAAPSWSSSRRNTVSAWSRSTTSWRIDGVPSRRPSARQRRRFPPEMGASRVIGFRDVHDGGEHLVDDHR